MRGVSPGNWPYHAKHTTQTHFLPSVSGTQRRGLHTYIHSYCYHRTCHKYTHRDTMPYRQTCHTNITYILATPTTHSDTQNHTCSYILAAPATKKQTRKAKTKQKKTKQKFHKVRSNASLEALPCSLHPLLLICTVQFFDLWNCCGSELHPPKKIKTSCATHMVPGNRFCHCIFPKTRH